MKCALCHEEIDSYSPEFNHFEIDDKRSADICSPCLDKLMKWRQSVSSRLFPTRGAKRYLQGKQAGEHRDD